MMILKHHNGLCIIMNIFMTTVIEMSRATPMLPAMAGFVATMSFIADSFVIVVFLLLRFVAE